MAFLYSSRPTFLSRWSRCDCWKAGDDIRYSAQKSLLAVKTPLINQNREERWVQDNSGILNVFLMHFWDNVGDILARENHLQRQFVEPKTLLFPSTCPFALHTAVGKVVYLKCFQLIGIRPMAFCTGHHMCCQGWRMMLMCWSASMRNGVGGKLPSFRMWMFGNKHGCSPTAVWRPVGNINQLCLRGEVAGGICHRGGARRFVWLVKHSPRKWEKMWKRWEVKAKELEREREREKDV